MIEERFRENKISSRGMYMRNIADITPKWKDIRIADIIPNGSYLRSNADIPKLYDIPPRSLENEKKVNKIESLSYL